GGKVTVAWTLETAKEAELAGKDMWKKFPRAMLRARVISEGIRTVFPGVLAGMYTPEEVRDMQDVKGEAEDFRSNPIDPPPPVARKILMPRSRPSITKESCAVATRNDARLWLDKG
ncbi:MAG: recombinase RecT, partial [Planctomycetes bacterium]|nr:recombinase RecT [Planctomycetota bacterium]